MNANVVRNANVVSFCGAFMPIKIKGTQKHPQTNTHTPTIPKQVAVGQLILNPKTAWLQNMHV